MIKNLRKPVSAGVALLIGLSATGLAFANTIVGPSTSQSPYVVRSEPGVVTKSILTVGDSVNAKPDGTPYRLVGIPDGMGAFDNGDGTFTLLVNHELPANRGITRAHGSAGAFVSKWVIRKDDLTVVQGQDLIQNVVIWNNTANSFNPPALGVTMGRLCSADLPAQSAFYDAASGLGYAGRLFMNGEETGAEGRAFAHDLNGTSYELPWLGKFSWENSVANPASGVKTVVVGLDDSGGGQVYVYIGNKTTTGSPTDKAGLNYGTLYGVKVAGTPAENTSNGIPSGSAFSLHSFGDASRTPGAQLESDSIAAQVTAFQRPEDGAWDPSNPNDFYFVTTASFSGNSRLWRLRFVDAKNPELGGTIDMLLDGTEGQKMMDNMTVTDRGQIFIQEDPGNQPYIAKVWRYSIADDTLTQIAEHDSARFVPGAPSFLTQDEESSGIISVDNILGEGWFILNVQAHYATDAELVEGGQLIALHYPPGRGKAK